MIGARFLGGGRPQDDQVLAIAPHMGAVNIEGSLQVSDVIQKPASCVLKVTRLAEPSLTCL